MGPPLGYLFHGVYEINRKTHCFLAILVHKYFFWKMKRKQFFKGKIAEFDVILLECCICMFVHNEVSLRTTDSCYTVGTCCYIYRKQNKSLLKHTSQMNFSQFALLHD